MSCLRHAALVVLLVVIGALSQQQQQQQQQQQHSWQRPRRQFIGSEWVPLSHPCPTCRQFTDSSDNRPNYDDIGLVPPRPPPAPRQVQNTGNFFPPPLQQNVFNQQRPRFPDFTFNQFPQQQTHFPPQPQFTQPQQQQSPFPQPPQFTQQPPFFTPQQQQSFLPQTYLNNPQLLLNENPQLFPLVNNQQLLLNQQKPLPAANTGKESQIRFRPEAPRLELNKPPQNIQLEQDKVGPTNAPETHLQLPLNAAPTPFQVGPQTFGQQAFPQFQQQPAQSLLQAPRDPFSPPPSAPAINNSDIVIPGLDKEEIQLLYVPVETLRERGQLQGHTLEEPRNHFLNQFQQLQQAPPGHFITQHPGSPVSQSPAPSSVTPPPALTQNLPLRNQPENFSGSTATATPLGLSTTEQVVTIQPRPVSTVRQSDSSASTFSRTPSSPQTTRFTNSPFPKKEISSNEVTPSFEAATEATFATTTLQPHQPPLAIYVTSNQGPGTVNDILANFKLSDSVAVIDNFSPNNPKVFVGPGSLNAPDYNKFELPYLSNLEPSRIEQRDNLPFFVAPLNFNTPQGFLKIPFPAPHVGAVVYSDESEAEVTTQTEATTTTVRSRGRRPSQNKQSYRRPVSSSRQRVASKPQEEEVTPEYDSLVTSQRLRDPQQERKRLSQSRRQRVRTTTEAVTEAVQASDLHHETAQTASPAEDFDKQVTQDLTQIPEQKLQEPVHPPVDFRAQVQPQSAQLQQPQYLQDDFVPPPPPSAFDARRPQPTQFPSPVPTVQQQHFETPKFEMFHPTPEEIQGIFGLASPSPRPLEDESTLRNDHVTKNEYSTPSSLKHFREEDEEKELTESEEEGKQLENLDIAKKRPSGSRFEPTHTKSTTRQRASTTTVAPEYDTENAVVTSTEAPKTSSKYLSQFNRSRKPLRTTSARPETTTSVPSTRGHTVRPLRRSTLRTSVSTKRIRKPTTPLPDTDSDTNEEASQDPQFSPSGVSNEINDERPVAAPKPKFRKQFFPKNKYSTEQTTTSPSTRTYQERVDENHSNDDRFEFTAADHQVTHAPRQAESDTHESLAEEKKKSHDTEHKKTRRRLRVKVQKRPQDNFETAESQNHGAVSNLLVSPSHKPTAPDLYRFGKGEFDFEDSVKFIATHNKEHARNITADILESTDSFSSPGSDTTVQHVTIVSDHTTVMPAALVSVEPAETVLPGAEPTNASPTEAEVMTTIVQHETTTAIPHSATTKPEISDSTKFSAKQEVTEFAVEVTTQADVADETTLVADVTSPTVTTPSSTTTESPKGHKQQRKVLRTSTTTQVSHETEICYKGKCIKTNSNNPELALKRLVEQANSEESTKVKT